MLGKTTFKISTLALAISISSSVVALEQSKTISIKQQSLSNALTSLAKQTDIQIFARDKVINGLNVGAVDQAKSVKEALVQLLKNTNLEAHWISDTDVVIKHKKQNIKAHSIVKPSNNLVRNNKSLEHISIYGRHNKLILESGTATKSNMSLMETPAAIVVVDKFLLDEQSTSTLQDSLRNISGLTHSGNNYGIGDNLIIRGLGANYIYDGMYGGAGLGNSYNPTRSTTNVESIEVLKGPATGLYGTGSAGGVINLVEKKPLDKPFYQVKATVGQWDNHSMMLDATSAINDSMAYRFVANIEETDGYRSLSSARNEMYASLRLNLPQDQELIFSTAFIDDKNQVDSIGHPVRILNLDSINANPGEITWQDLINDSDSDNDKIIGLQLSDAQRQDLANSLNPNDGLKPYDLGSQGLISPMSKPNEGKELRLKVSHTIDFSNDTSLHQQVQFRDYDTDFIRQTGAFNYVYWDRNGEINANPRAPLVIDNIIYPFSARRQQYRRSDASETSWQYFADFSTSWSLGRFEGEHLASANYEKRSMEVKSWSLSDADANSSSDPLPYIFDIRNPNWPTKSFMASDPTLTANYDSSVTSYGVSFQEVLYFNDILTGRFGLAHSKIEQTYQHKGTPKRPDIAQEEDYSDSGITFNFGLNYRLTDEFASFVNYSKGRTASSILGFSDIPDSESKSFDLGIRFTAFDEELLASLIYFETRKTNINRAHPLYNDDPKDTDYNISVPKYVFDNEDNTQGYEFDMNMALNDVWSMNFNATYQDAIEIRNQNDTPESGQRKGIPKKFASIWTSYSHSISELNNPIKFSLGITYTGQRSINSNAFGLPDSTIDSYTVLDAAISYDVENWNIQLNLRNLTDETYYAKALFIGGLPGDSRNAKLTARYTF
ncbi:TonB-dependent receptor [Pseudoalteromonas denitrificans]|uniref:Outer membrane receptor for ferric coprogen and ferric-rhodotorulic acid n=1 Tax=Pseudoalteromonas denitrificans DSM 6059 TaxID=1123010 RepID=A0A1I1IAJ1_9GAMM|nr:TonB-dependent receptor [Pseudoalteromonas denitrificans]SFC32812.1 Outer membrane receptor for ferric coprogen and ferric-rhodotorulic acid [Pseudoalteromonas denitrificans DSM 6059]